MNGACIFFDLDGTLVDSLPGIEFSVREALRVCGLPALSQSLREMIGPPIREILARISNVRDESTLHRLERSFRASYDGEGWRRTVSFPAANQVLRALHEQGNQLFVVSNKPRHISLRVLERERIIEYFEAIVTRDSRSPGYGAKEEMIESLLKERAIARERCLMVGDTSEDARAAAAVGIKFICMTHGYGTLDRISLNPGSPVPVAHRVDNFSQLLPLITTELVCD